MKKFLSSYYDKRRPAFKKENRNMSQSAHETLKKKYDRLRQRRDLRSRRRERRIPVACSPCSRTISTESDSDSSSSSDCNCRDRKERRRHRIRVKEDRKNRKQCPSWCHDCLGRGCRIREEKVVSNCDRGWPSWQPITSCCPIIETPSYCCPVFLSPPPPPPCLPTYFPTCPPCSPHPCFEYPRSVFEDPRSVFEDPSYPTTCVPPMVNGICTTTMIPTQGPMTCWP